MNDKTTKTLHVEDFTLEEYKTLLRAKVESGKNWHDFLLELVKEGEK